MLSLGAAFLLLSAAATGEVEDDAEEGADEQQHQNEDQNPGRGRRLGGWRGRVRAHRNWSRRRGRGLAGGVRLLGGRLGGLLGGGGRLDGGCGHVLVKKAMIRI